MQDIEHFLEVAKLAASRAADIILTAFDKPKLPDFKGATNLVTQTDKDADYIICKTISDHFPEHGLLAEESGAYQESEEYQWIIDPLDGTTNFVHGFPSIGISIGLQYKKETIVSCVCELPQENYYVAAFNHGAFKNDAKIHVSKISEIQSSLLLTGFGYNHGELWEKNMILFKRFTDISQGVRRLGAAAVDLCHVACGVIDGFWEFDLHPWDTAAGILLIKEAGGKVTDMQGSSYSIFGNNIVASNSLLHDKLLKEIQQVL